MNMPFDQVVSGRVTAEDKKLLDDSEYNVRHAVQYFNKHAQHPKKKLLVKKFFVKEEIGRLKDQRDCIDEKIIAEERHLEAINIKLGIVELNGKEYSLEVSNAVNNIIQRYNNSIHDLDDYLTINHLFVENQSALVDVTVEELEELVKEKVSKQSL